MEQDKELYERQIKIVDAQIDRLVYDLYGLADEETEWLHAAATNPAFDFLKDPEEDVYTLADGDRFVDRSIKPQHTESDESQ